MQLALDGVDPLAGGPALSNSMLYVSWNIKLGICLVFVVAADILVYCQHNQLQCFYFHRYSVV